MSEHSDFSQIESKVRSYLPAEKVRTIEAAFRFAAEAHCGQTRKSGEPYLEHPLQTALILAELQLDGSSVAAALLHDITEDCGIAIKDLEAKFGAEIARLVDGTTKLSKVSSISATSGVSSPSQSENLRKMLVAMAQDLRVVFIKLADRLHNMRTLDALPPDRQRSIAQETLDIYAPLAHRLGIWELKWQLEDLSFRYLEPLKYRRVARLLVTRRAHREQFINQAVEILKRELDKAGIKAELSGRPKHIYSIHQKMEKYARSGKEFDDIHDLMALRVIVGAVPDCYSAVGVIHSLWHPLPEAFDDYIANPKPNGYQALHTAVMCLGSTPLEIQIRTREMHYVSEYGVAAHWRYKEGEKKDINFEEKLGWLRQLVEWHRQLSGEEFLESVKTDIFIDQVFVYTPKGEIKDLPKGATPIDYAYLLHTELGHRCIGAKVNGRLVPFNYQLKNGDLVEIVTSKVPKGPSRDWLNPELGFIKTSQAREKIRQWFKKQERADNIEHGRVLLDKELKRIGVVVALQELAAMFSYASQDDFLAAIGYGGLTTHQIVLKLAAQREPPRGLPEVAPSKAAPSTVQVLGMGNMVTHLAQCCHPVPGDNIIGYITRNRGVTIHRRDCYNVVHEDETERLVPVAWGDTDALYPVNVQVEAWDRVGLMRDISTMVAEDNINITSINVGYHDDYTAQIDLVIETKGLAQLSRILKKIETVKGIISVTRVGKEAKESAPVKNPRSDSP
ncbi:MAG: bifunctional (p)ppGpp synthetase/guanosine-3',5'-bis(diphosphate) 3'-pyrophosphohydrolase [Chloroflexi bacterium]|nr:bifunctional (p)ppGpp synthetase/guanosine-3',5'-bis(diphosphate) 3'-pyrophosphohydrolase [Chloroflexota bacterium]